VINKNPEVQSFGFVLAVHKVGYAVFDMRFNTIIDAPSAIYQIIGDVVLAKILNKFIIKMKNTFFDFQQVILLIVFKLLSNISRSTSGRIKSNTTKLSPKRLRISGLLSLELKKFLISSRIFFAVTSLESS